MSTIRRFAYAVFGVACTHLVFGAIVRISGSGMGCGPHWPKCYGRWFPPMERPDLVIEVTHRYLASILLLSLIGLTVAAFRRRAEPGIGGRGGVLRMASLATGLGFTAAILGAVTVKLANSAPATVAHWTVAMSLVAAVTATLIRAGGLGGASARLGGATAKARRGTFAGAVMALIAVVMGGLTAKIRGGSVACLNFPLCGANPAVPTSAVHVQSTHRVIAVLLVLHLVGLFFGLRKRREAAVIRRASVIALGLGVLQLLVAGAMIGMHLPPVLRSLHEATGVSIWIATFALAYLARLASDDRWSGQGARGTPAPDTPLSATPGLATASVRAPAPRPALASAPPAPAAVLPRIASLEPVTEAAPAPITRARATPSLGVAPLMQAYHPHRSAPVIIEVPVATPAPAPATRRADARLELPAALRLASRVATSSALGFHGVASRAVVASLPVPGPGDSDETEEREPAIARAVSDVSDIDYADVVDVEMLDLLADAYGSGVTAVTSDDAPAPAEALATVNLSVIPSVLLERGEAPYAGAFAAGDPANDAAVVADAIAAADAAASVAQIAVVVESEAQLVAEALSAAELAVVAPAEPAPAEVEAALIADAIALADARAREEAEVVAASHGGVIGGVALEAADGVAVEVVDGVAGAVMADAGAIDVGYEDASAVAAIAAMSMASVAAVATRAAATSLAMATSSSIGAVVADPASADVAAFVAGAPEAAGDAAMAMDAVAAASVEETASATEPVPDARDALIAVEDGSFANEVTPFAENAAGGPPPTVKVTAEPEEEPHPFAARVSVSDAGVEEADAGVEADVVDDLYNLRGLDLDEDDVDVGLAMHVPTLDEEFSALATMVVEGDPTAVALAAGPVLVAAPVARGSIVAIAAMRRPSMLHSVAVIVARGADV